MDSGLYAACAGLVAKTQALDIAANNLANLSTNGYRVKKGIFHAVLGQTRVSDNQTGKILNTYGTLGESLSIFSQGTLSQTGNPLDLAIEGRGFFSIASGEGVRYTRDGAFHLSPTGYLENSAGEKVLGFQGPIRIPTGTTTISQDGNISVDGAIVARLKVVEFPASTTLKDEGSGRYSAVQNGDVLASTSTLRQGWMEGSNVDPAIATVDLINIQRQAEMLYRALNAFNSDLNKTAAEELSRI